jgi:hypothetical protein
MKEKRVIKNEIQTRRNQFSAKMIGKDLFPADNAENAEK